jgi:hypothetical protein
VSWLSRFRRGDMRTLRIGDVVRYKMLFQSRTGYLVGARVQGRVLSLEIAEPAKDHPIAQVTGLLEDAHGIVQPFVITQHERLYVRRLSDRDINRRAAETAKGQESHDAETFPTAPVE